MRASSVLHGAVEPFSIHGELCVHRIFERQVERTPGAVAVTDGPRRVTYAELDDRANRLANYLTSRGVGTESLVAICMTPCLEMVVAIFGILKAGGAYVPIDPQYPRKRIEYMLGDAAPVVVLATRDVTTLPESPAIVRVDDDWPSIAAASSERPSHASAPEHLAYVIYTSGSTGNPKGVLVEHRGVANYLTWCLAAYDVANGIGSAVHSPLSFDLTVTSLFSPLVCGLEVVVVPARQGAAGLVEAASTHRNLSLIKLTPLHLELLGQQMAREGLDVNGWTRAFVIGGENLLAGHVAFWRTNARETRLFNEYGPTETVVGCCVYELTPDVASTAVIPIGQPIFNTHLYVLDDAQQPVEPGSEGELYIGGAGVARGYLHRPELTAERFLDNPFDGGRMYRTGDLVRCLPDGNLEFIGRIDDQVKVKGHRIELGEIESALREHPQIKEVAVVIVGTGAETKLIAAIVERDTAPTLMQLKQFCLERLPRYMVVDRVKVFAALPVTPNGKVDRRALVTAVETDAAGTTR